MLFLGRFPCPLPARLFARLVANQNQEHGQKTKNKQTLWRQALHGISSDSKISKSGRNIDNQCRPAGKRSWLPPPPISLSFKPKIFVFLFHLFHYNVFWKGYFTSDQFFATPMSTNKGTAVSICRKEFWSTPSMAALITGFA